MGGGAADSPRWTEQQERNHLQIGGWDRAVEHGEGLRPEAGKAHAPHPAVACSPCALGRRSQTNPPQKWEFAVNTHEEAHAFEMGEKRQKYSHKADWSWKDGVLYLGQVGWRKGPAGVIERWTKPLVQVSHLFPRSQTRGETGTC